ncbi:peptide-methionine (S)-S-oxide reductase [Tindallia magadiensis]|uniref:peptide-methionine (S)-S-oxide reductase n=2 Tax=Tindallia magadiensis TaxID=69895 RepID=A0A1I3DUG5_9FIRM|nr:peptide-methionine (S)-S-oxide reductase [Tindallia magadiensis]
MKGVIRTRVGYAGGEAPDPTYRKIEDHSEVIQIEYDPSVIDYETLLEVFWNSHDPTVMAYSRQYMSILLFHDEEQEKIIERSRQAYEEKSGKSVLTEIKKLDKFYSAEGYHQKYYLQNRPGIVEEVRGMYSEFNHFVDSTTAARLNGYVAGKGTMEDFEQDIAKINLSEETEQRIRELLEILW